MSFTANVPEDDIEKDTNREAENSNINSSKDEQTPLL